MNDEPLTDIDAKLDELCKALAQCTDLERVMEALSAYEHMVALVPPDDPQRSLILNASLIWPPFIEVCEGILKLRRIKKEGN